MLLNVRQIQGISLEAPALGTIQQLFLLLNEFIPEDICE